MAKLRYIRVGDGLSDEVRVVRGGVLNPKVLRSDASRMHNIYGVYGISVFAIRDVTLDELAQQPPLVRFAGLSLIAVGSLRTAGLSIEPMGRDPRHYTVTFGELDWGVARLCSCPHEQWQNPYHES